MFSTTCALLYGSLLFVSGARSEASPASSSGVTVQVNNLYYYVPSHAVGYAERNASADRNELFTFAPITVIHAGRNISTCQDVKTITNSFLLADDVIQDAFTHSVYMQRDYSGVYETKNASCLKRITSTSGETLPVGPYFLSALGSVHEAFRLYVDTQGAFAETSVSSVDGSHTVLSANIGGQALSVAVPSRLYHPRTDDKPLGGMRLGVKDIYDIKGLKTSNGNRAWYHLYPSANETAIAVQKLVDAGAIIVGKMKTSQFANGETATADWIDVLAPFNPRGDGYEDPSSSSAGPAAGIAAYEWLDISLGSDTGGSIRSPSQIQGIFGNRPSHGLVSLKGAMPLSPSFDTAGVMARDAEIWTQAAQALYTSNMTFTDGYPSSLLTIGFAENPQNDLEKMLAQFLGDVKKFLGADSRTFNLSATWASSQPNRPALQSIVNNTYEILSASEQVAMVREPFYKDYAERNQGRLPHVNPAPLQRWALADASSLSTIQDAKTNQTLFRDWFNSEVLAPGDKICSEHLLVYVPRIPTPKYRDVYLSGPALPSAFSTSRISVLSGSPDIVIPIGEIPFRSKITNHTEYLPVTVDFMAAKGCDGMLLSLVRDLQKKGIVRRSVHGKSNVNGGDILM